MLLKFLWYHVNSPVWLLPLEITNKRVLSSRHVIVAEVHENGCSGWVFFCFVSGRPSSFLLSTPLFSDCSATWHERTKCFCKRADDGGECMGVRARLSVSLEIAQRDKAGLREAEMLMWTKVCSLCNVYESLYFMQGLSSLRWKYVFAGVQELFLLRYPDMFLVSRDHFENMSSLLCVCLCVCARVCVCVWERVRGTMINAPLPHHVYWNACMPCNNKPQLTNPTPTVCHSQWK